MSVVGKLLPVARKRRTGKMEEGEPRAHLFPLPQVLYTILFFLEVMRAAPLHPSPLGTYSIVRFPQLRPVQGS